MMGLPLDPRTRRKFLRNRLAVVSLVIIGVYVLVALIVACGGISLDSTEKRVGVKNLPGFNFGQLPEKRVNDSRLWLEQIKEAVRKENPDPASALDGCLLMSVADKPIDELLEIITRAEGIYEEFEESKNLDNDPDMLPKVNAFEETVNELFAPLGEWESRQRAIYLMLGTDELGRSILMRGVYSIKVALMIGMVTSLVSVFFGSALGAAAAFFGGWVDHVVTWLYTTFSSIPYLVLLVLLAYMFTGSALENTLLPVYTAFCLTFWIGPCRVIRGETLKIKELEYVQAATIIGLPRVWLLIRHVLPNAAHLMLINFSLLFIAAIKSEVILSYLQLGVREGPSWGNMISDSKPEVLSGFFWQIGTATFFMFVLVLAFNILTDALQDVFDPKHL